MFTTARTAQSSRRWLSLGFTAALLGLASQSLLADPTCSSEPKNQWKDAKDFQKQLEGEGYKIKKFKETDTGCYEIYGWNKEGKKVEIYFNPVNGEPVKTEIDD